MGILELLGLGNRQPPADTPAAQTETVRKIVRELDGLPESQAGYVAAFAYMLSRVARADLSVSEEETRAMERIVVDHGGLPEEQAVIVVQMAKTQNLLFGGTENYLVSREFHRLTSHEQKLSLIDCLYAVSASEDGISSAEDQVIRQIADELLLEHSDYIAVRSRYRGQLQVLRGDDAD